jgi:hypothetical protein
MSAQLDYAQAPTYRIWWRLKGGEGRKPSIWYKMMTGDKSVASANQEVAHYTAKHPEREYLSIPNDGSPNG